MRKIKIGPRLILSFAVILLLMITSMLYSIIMLNSMDKDVSNIFKYRVEPLEQLDKINTYFNRLSSNLRQVYISGSEESGLNTALSQFENTKKALSDSLIGYKNTLESNPNVTTEGRNKINNLIAQIENKYYPLANNVVSLVKAGDLDGAGAIFLSAETAQLATDTTEMVMDLFDFNMNIALEASEKQSSDTASTIMFVTVLGVASVIISVLLAVLLIQSLTKPVKRITDALGEVAKGNMNINIETNATDEIGELAKYTRSVVDVVQRIIDEIKRTSDEVNVKGDIDARINSASFTGAYLEVADGVNKIVEESAKDLLITFDVLAKFSSGDFNVTIAKLPGKKATLNKSIDSMRNNLESVTKEIGVMVNGAIDGNLSNRANLSGYKGDWAEIMKSLNSLMEAIAKPISEASDVLKQVAVGNFKNKVNGNYKGDFLTIKNSVNDTITNIASYIDEISNVLEGLANRDLDQSITREYVGRFSNIKNALNNIADTLSEVIGDILSASDQVSSGAKQISDSSMTLAQGATEQASAVQELNATILTINESTHKNADSAKEAQTLSESSKDNATRGDNDMQNMLTSMESIKESSNSISKIIKVINDIAFQTNLLALNAAVEAARAGEHGKGFAVVAEEVRTLAVRSQNAAKDTSALIEESIERVNGGTKIAAQTASALRTIVDDVDKVAGIINGIASASSEQALGISQVTEGISQIANVVQSNSATSEESASASEELSSQAEMLQSLVSTFKLKRK